MDSSDHVYCNADATVTFTITTSNYEDAPNRYYEDAPNRYYELRHHHPERSGWAVPKKLVCAPRIRRHRKAKASSWKKLQARRTKHKR